MEHSYVCVVVGSFLGQQTPGHPTVVVASRTHWGRKQPGGVTPGGQGLTLVEVAVGQSGGARLVIVVTVSMVFLTSGQVVDAGL